jgi:hypothetical protein
MTIPTDVASLTELFRKLGAPYPEGWAKSEVEEGIPQLLRFLFLREAWKNVLAEDDTAWVDAYIAHSDRRKDGPYAGIGHALKKLRACGVRDQDITDVVRGMQAELLFGVCYLLDGHDASEPEVADILWSLFQTDTDGKPLRSFGALHESVLETDPTGREMRPKV